MRIEEAKLLLEELQKQLVPGGSVVIVRNGKPVAQLTQSVDVSSDTPSLGFWKDKAEIIADDDEHLRDFADFPNVR